MGMPVMAGPFDPADFEKVVPSNKKLDPAWIKSLFERGTKTVYRGKDLEKIGMPVGGLCSGQLYLGGDGKLWHWDIFNQYVGTGAEHYANPMTPQSPIDQGFGIRTSANGKTEFRTLDHTGFTDIAFRGEYPIGQVDYRDANSPVAVTLEAFSPFVPLNTDDSSLPATILQFTVKNVGKEKIDAELLGWLQNPVCLHTAKSGDGRRSNRIIKDKRLTLLDCSAEAAKQQPLPKDQPDIVFDNFQKETYEGWTVTGTAFGKGPILKSDIPKYQGDVGSKSLRVVNSHASAPQGTPENRDAHIGTLTSKPFVVERGFINFWIGGGNHPGKTSFDLLIDGKVMVSATGHDNNAMRRDTLDVRHLLGKTAQLRIVDNETGSWGNIGVAEIVFSNQPVVPIVKLEDRFDFGTITLGLLDPQSGDTAATSISPQDLRQSALVDSQEATTKPVLEKLVGALARRVSLEPGQSATATFVLTWRFPNLRLPIAATDGGRFYAVRFPSAAKVAEYVAENFDSLNKQTRLWRDTWYDSTLPYWFLDRTFANTSILASSTSYRFRTGRFYGWEGVGCCEGTCTHVWLYAQAVGRLFPDLERDLRVRTDFGTGMIPETGAIRHRGETWDLAVDGQAGCILRVYREHQMSTDSKFLKSLWPKVKKAMDCLVRMDDQRGLLEGPQHNTLDQPWFGRVAWLSSLYVAAARACEEMAKEMGDAAYAEQMRQIAGRGGKSIDRELFNGEYYIQIADKAHTKSVGSHDGCEIDQVLGQSWAYQVGLGRILDKRNVQTALESLWRYNFTPDVGPFRNKYKPGRWYAMAGEGGLLMCTWPKGDAKRCQEGFDFYFNECMNGFEYQVAWHMIWEGMVEQGLAIARAVHDRYDASRRNPWNEVECGDHYARSMASYGVFLAACGFEYHGPKGYLAFAPRLSPEDFRAAFTGAEGWGTLSQKREKGRQTNTIAIRWGKLSLKTLAVDLPENATLQSATVTLGDKTLAAQAKQEGKRVTLVLNDETTIQADEILKVALTF
jgi:uncharacterized protein (DUF608 family)